MTIIAKIDKLAHTYANGTPAACQALKNVSLTIQQGSTTALAGESGAGKSTLALYLSGLLRSTRSGHVVIFEQDTALGKPVRGVGLVFQYPQQQLFERYVGDDVAYGPAKMGLTGAELTERVAWAMNMVGLDFDLFVDRETFSLSGGEMRRTALAGVIAMQPKLLILDEATTGLDPAGQELIRSIIVELKNTLNTTTLLISNDMDEIASIADNLILMHQGGTIAAGSVRQILEDEQLLRTCALVQPAAMRILKEAKQSGLDIRHSALSLDEAEEELWQALHR